MSGARVLYAASLRSLAHVVLTSATRYMQLVRVYTKKRGNPPDFKEPCVLTMGRNGCTVESVCRHLHRDLVREFKCALSFFLQCYFVTL